MIPRIVATPFADGAAPPADGKPRRVGADVLAAVLPGPGRDRLAAGEVLAVTTGQQPGLFTGPLYTIYKALSALVLARRLERERRMPVVPVFWVAGDDHDFAEANHAWVLSAAGEAVRIVLRERAAEAPLLPLFREPCGAEIRAALEQLRTTLPDTEFKAGVVAWLEAAYRPETNLADAGAEALHRLLGARGLAVFRAHDAAAKRAAAPWLLRGLEVTLPDGLTPVLVEGRAGRDRLRAEAGAFVTRRSGERFTRAQLEQVAAETPERLSPNVLLRPVVEAALFPTVAYAAGPGELAYLPDAAPLYERLGVVRQTPIPRWSGVLLEGRVEKVMQKHGLALADFERPPGSLEAHVVSESLAPDVEQAFAGARQHIDEDYSRLAAAVGRLDPTLERTVQSARNAALAGTHDVEKKLVASLKRSNETVVGQLARARAALAPEGKPQERMLTAASFLVRYGPDLMDALEAEVARAAGAP
ncbi:MAG TPA: bacillithiol biosynthesis BshC [Gemmatimonadales bacterium]|nr:bacillithiol biosynthesis BshC [Gemmatimonadales bacterium]